MAEGVEVGRALLTVIPNMEGAQRTITEQISEVCGTAGNEGGSLFANGFGVKLGALKGALGKLIPAASVGAIGKALFDVGSEFDDMTDTIIVGTGASGQALEDLKKSAMDIATTVPTSFASAGDTVQDLNTRLGLTGDTLTEVGTQVQQLGDLTGEAFNTEAFAGAMSAWGTSAENMSGQLDTLFAISQSTGININSLTGIVESAAPQMQTLGYSFEETAAMAGLLDKAGLDASGTMSKMSKALTTLAQDGEDPADAMQRITEEIGAYIDAGDEAAAISAASDLFGTRGAMQFVAAVQSGSMSIEEFADAMSNSEGIIGDTEEQTMDFAERVTILKNQFKELLEPMGSAVFSGLSTAMSVLTTAFGNFVNGPGQVIGTVFQNIISFGQGVVEVFAEAFGSTTGLTSFGDAANKVGGIVTRLFGALKPVLNVLSSLLRTVIPPLARLLGGALGVAFRAIGRVVSSVAATFRTFKGVIGTVKKAFETFKRVVTAPFRFLSGLKIPHISVSGGKAPWGIGGAGQKPSFSVKWGAKGGILDGATLIGGGEAGKEALLPLERNTQWMDTLADKINSNGDISIALNYDASEDANDMLIDLARGVQRYRMAGAI